MARDPRVVWATHPRHLPSPPHGRVVVVDVAFAAGNSWKSKTMKFIDALGPRMLRWVDHHLHKQGWEHVADDPRFVLVPNKIAHACPELVTPELVESTEQGTPVDVVVAHADFDGMLAAMKWRAGGVSPYAEADEDARAIDSPGRGHVLSERGARLAYALDEASAAYDRDERLRLLTDVAGSLLDSESIGLESEIDDLARAARDVEARAIDDAAKWGKEEASGVFVVRAPGPLENRVRKHLLVFAEERARVGALYEPDPAGGAWVTAATFDEAIDLEEVAGFEGGRSDYRFARAKHGDGAPQIDALAEYLARVG